MNIHLRGGITFMRSVKTRLGVRLSTLLWLSREVLFGATPEPVPATWFTRNDIAGYDAVLPDEGFDAVDQSTWRDLDMDAYLAQITPACSIFGRQYIYAMLRRGADASGRTDLKKLSESVTAAVLAEARTACAGLRHVDLELTHVLYRAGLVRIPAVLTKAWISSALLILAASLMLLKYPGLSACAAFAYFCVYSFIHLRFASALNLWNRQRASTVAMLVAARSSGSIPLGTSSDFLGELAELRQSVTVLIKRLAPSAVECKPTLVTYLNILFLYEYVKVAHTVRVFEQSIAALQNVYLGLAKLEAQTTLLVHLRGQAVHCWATSAEPNDIELLGVVNPMLTEATPLSLTLRARAAFLSGQNGVGKSTFLRTIGLNLLVARAFGFCYARYATVPMLPVWTSVHNEDSLSARESLYMAEMRRAETLLAVSTAGRAVFLVDEIFRGTNYLESAASAAAVLNHLASQSIVVVSSHNLVLATLLNQRYLRWRLVIPILGAAVIIEPGVIVETNGVAMMEKYCIPESVRSDARGFARQLLELQDSITNGQ